MEEKNLNIFKGFMQFCKLIFREKNLKALIAMSVAATNMLKKRLLENITRKIKFI